MLSEFVGALRSVESVVKCTLINSENWIRVASYIRQFISIKKRGETTAKVT